MMQIAILNGVLSEAEQEFYIRHITKKYPANLVEKIILDVQPEHVDVRCILHRFRDMRKMGGYCIGEPSTWNPAKQAELRDTIPNPINL